jgi:hypothetical protein
MQLTSLDESYTLLRAVRAGRHPILRQIHTTTIQLHTVSVNSYPETITKWKVGLTSSIPSQLSRFFHQPAGRQPAPAITDAHGHLEWPIRLLGVREEGGDFF